VYFVSIYENRRTKPVEIVLRKEGRRVRENDRVVNLPPVQLFYVNNIIKNLKNLLPFNTIHLKLNSLVPSFFEKDILVKVTSYLQEVNVLNWQEAHIQAAIWRLGSFHVVDVLSPTNRHREGKNMKNYTQDAFRVQSGGVLHHFQYTPLVRTQVMATAIARATRKHGLVLWTGSRGNRFCDWIAVSDRWVYQFRHILPGLCSFPVRVHFESYLMF
jgi:hypothetical protein